MGSNPTVFPGSETRGLDGTRKIAAWYIGITPVFDAGKVGSIPTAATKIKNMENSTNPIKITDKAILYFQTMLERFSIIGSYDTKEGNAEWWSSLEDGRPLRDDEKIIALHFKALGKL